MTFTMIETMGEFRYRAFGLNFSSEIPFPELMLREHDGFLEDVVIEKGDLVESWGKQVLLPKQKYAIQEQTVMFQVSNIAIFRIQDGKNITVSPLSGYDEDQVRLYILGTCMGAILMQRKILPLHGSVVAIDGKAYAIVGDSGAGKSTLASSLLNRGFQLLTDDVIAVSFSEEGIPLVAPSYPQQKLWKESLELFGMESNHYQPLFEREEKFAIPVQSHFTYEPLPLAGIFELVKGDFERVEIEPINSLERVFKLYYHTYRNFFLQRAGLMEWHFQTTTNMANKIDFYQLRRPTNSFTAHKLTDIILNTIKREEPIYG